MSVVPLRIKCCGIMSVADAEAAIGAGFDAIGLVFAARSRRRVALAQALEIRRAVGARARVVALFMDNAAAEVDAAIARVAPDLLQFHGAEAPAWCARFEVPWMKALALGAGTSVLDDLEAWAGAAAVLLDGHLPGEAGGSGTRFDWAAVRGRVQRPWILAGGLDASNVGAAIRASHPWGVDVSSGVERSPGHKDAARMERFVAAVRAHAADLADDVDA